MALIWVLTGAKTGDNAQVLRAVNAMGLPFTEKRIMLKPEFDTAKPAVAPSLHVVDLTKSDALEAPWPDLVVTIGRRLSLPALWIKAQSNGTTRIALFNAPKGRTDDFDLIVVPSFYNIADDPRICRIGLPLIAADPQRIASAAEAFAPDFADIRRPLHVLLLGGDMGARRLDAGFAAQTLCTMQAGFARDGSIYVSTSRRTPADAVAAVAAGLRPQDRLYRWQQKDAFRNPYLALLAHGETFTVTSDSVSMLTEVARLGRPLAIAEPPARQSVWQRLSGFFGHKSARDLGEASKFLIRGGCAVRLGEAPPASASTPEDDTLRVAARLRQIALTRD